MADVLTIEDLHKHFGSGSHIVQANAGITMTVGAGEVVGLLALAHPSGVRRGRFS